MTQTKDRCWDAIAGSLPCKARQFVDMEGLTLVLNTLEGIRLGQ